ncbi:MAG: NAD-dependent epimerase/dehydratase family protein [candidate division Zixibacteria bacterium]|nr:NAD-dependent epimerase/dehydratase family protein [candidate division Zixibacteria bacterium]
MKVLITGGAGFIGSHLADGLLSRGDEVLVIDNYSTARRDNLAPHRNLKVVEGTIADRELVYGLWEDFKPDFVVHAAASFKDPDNWEEDARTNTLGGAIVTQASLKTKVKRLIYFQTALCYGVKPLEQPITLDHPMRPGDSSYAISKTAAEQYIALSGIDFISFRLANAYGPRNLSGPLPTFYNRLTNGLKCFVMDTRRDFIYIQDVIDVVLLALYGKGKRGVYHVSSGKDFSIKELFDHTVEALGITLEEEVEVRERSPDDAFTILLDPSKTTEDFGWRPTRPLAEGIKSAIEWYKTHGVSQTFTHLKNLGAKQ